jgi:hypothetical protein
MINQSFADVPVTDAGVDTAAFLQASEGVLGLFGLPMSLKSHSRYSYLAQIYLDPLLSRPSRVISKAISPFVSSQFVSTQF